MNNEKKSDTLVIYLEESLLLFSLFFSRGRRLDVSVVS